MSVPLTPRRIARHFAVDAVSTASLPRRSRNFAAPTSAPPLCPLSNAKKIHDFEKPVARPAKTQDLPGHSEAVARVRASHKDPQQFPLNLTMNSTQTA